MVKGSVVKTPEGALPYAVVIMADDALLRREPAYDRQDADRLLHRLLAAATADGEADAARH